MVTIEGASADDIGLYKCEASNNLVGPDGELLIDTVEIRIGVTGLLFESVFLKKKPGYLIFVQGLCFEVFHRRLVANVGVEKVVPI